MDYYLSAGHGFVVCLKFPTSAVSGSDSAFLRTARTSLQDLEKLLRHYAIVWFPPKKPLKQG